MAWLDSDGSDPRQWASVDEIRCGEDVRSTYERAVATDLPYDRRAELRGSRELVSGAFPEASHDFVRLQCYGAVDGDRQVTLNEQALLRGDEEYRRLQRRFRRPGEPSDTDPFEEWTSWEREIRGAVTREDGSVSFEDSAPEPAEGMESRSWEELSPFHQIIVAELELVRNSAYARHGVEESRRWDEFDDSFRYLLQSLGSPPRATRRSKPSPDAGVPTVSGGSSSCVTSPSSERVPGGRERRRRRPPRG